MQGWAGAQAKALEEEIHKLKELSHPNVVKFLDALPMDKELYIVTECTSCRAVGAAIENSC